MYRVRLNGDVLPSQLLGSGYHRLTTLRSRSELLCWHTYQEVLHLHAVDSVALTAAAQAHIMGADTHHSVASNAFAWFLNVSSAVTIVFVNKVLMDHKRGYAFTFGKKFVHSLVNTRHILQLLF